MADVLFTTVNAVLPIVLLILLGYMLRRFGFIKEGFVKTGNKLVFNVFLPCMLFINIYDGMDGFSAIRWDVVIYSLIVILVIFALGLPTALLTTKDGRRRGVLLQCTFRSNFAIIGLVLVARLGGDTALAGIVSAFAIPLFNILAVISLTLFKGSDSDPENSDQPRPARLKRFAKSGKNVLLGIVKNPLIIGVAVGLLFVAVREIERAACGSVPFRLDNQLKFLYTCISELKTIASPFALIVLGGQFRFSAVKGMTKEIIVGTVWRVALAPLIGIGAALLLSKFTPVINFGAEVYPTLIALFATPVAVSSAIMAGAMGGDEQLGTQYVVWTSLVSVLTTFFIVFLLMNFGYLTPQ